MRKAAKTAGIKFPKIVSAGSKRRRFVALLALVGIVALIVKYPVATADLVTTVVGGVDQFIQALGSAA